MIVHLTYYLREQHKETGGAALDFELPKEITDKLAELDAFIEAEIKPLERENMQFFDHRREHARTDWDHDGRPRDEWRALISEMERRADKAGHLRYGLPKSCGGSAASNLAIAAIREHLAAKGLGLHNDLQDKSSIVGNFPIIPALADYGTEEQKTYIEGIITGKKHLSFGLTEPGHGSDATWLETTGVRDGDMWVINGRKRWNSQVARAHANLVFARTSGKPGTPRASPLSSFRPTRPATTSSTITGRSTCPAITPRPNSRTCAFPTARSCTRKARG